MFLAGSKVTALGYKRDSAMQYKIKPEAVNVQSMCTDLETCESGVCDNMQQDARATSPPLPLKVNVGKTKRNGETNMCIDLSRRRAT